MDPKTGTEIIIPQASEAEGLTLDERAVALATAVSSECRRTYSYPPSSSRLVTHPCAPPSVDFDYFSRQ